MNKRPLPFVLASTNHGTLIVNRHDYACIDGKPAYGVGYNLLETATFDPAEAECLVALLKLQHRLKGDGVVFLDCGANVGVFTIETGRAMTNWGQVYAYEPQDFIFYALCGNIALNNLFNVEAHQVALGNCNQRIVIPKINYCAPGSYGSLTIKDLNSEGFLDVGQKIDYSQENGRPVQQITIDSIGHSRVDVMKIDVESMEVDLLAGSLSTIERCQPIVFIELLKSNPDAIKEILSHCGYSCFISLGKDMLSLPPQKALLESVYLNESGQLVIMV